MDKKGDIPFWLVMTIIILISLIVVLLIIYGASGKITEFYEWLRSMF